MRKALPTGKRDEASALMSTRSDRSLLKSLRTRNVLSSLRTEMPGKLVKIKLATDTANA